MAAAVAVAVAAAAATAAAAAAAAAAKISARRRHEKKIKIFTKTWKTQKFKKNIEKSMKINKNTILEELRINGRHHQILREKLPI